MAGDALDFFTGPAPDAPSGAWGAITGAVGNAVDTFKNVNRAAKHLDEQLSRNPVYKALQTGASLPSEAQNAVLGYGQRMVASRLGNMRQDPVGVGLTTLGMMGMPELLALPQARKQAGNEGYAVFHPNDPNIQARAQHAVGVDRLMDPSADPTFTGKLRNFAVQMGFQTLTDPLTYTGAGTEVAGDMALGRMGQGITRSLASAPEKGTIASAVRDILSMTATNVEERRGMTPEAITDLTAQMTKGGSTKEQIAQAIRDRGGTQRTQQQIDEANSLLNRAAVRKRRMEAQDSALLNAEEKNLKAGKISDRMRQRLLAEAYVYGTPGMRRDALKFGFDVKTALQEKIITPEESIADPMGLLRYKLRDQYDPGMRNFLQPTQLDRMLLGESKKFQVPKQYGFQKYSPENRPPDEASMWERMNARLGAGREAAANREAQFGISQALSVSKKDARSFLQDVQVKGVQGLKALSDLQVDSLLATGFPHMRNIGVLGYLSMGEAGMARAMTHFVLGVPKALVKTMEESGALSFFGEHMLSKYSPVRFTVPRPIRVATAKMLDHWDLSVRAARWEMLEKTNPEMTLLQRANRVNDDIGAYTKSNQITKVMRGYGANFPQWHGYVVPVAMTRALLRNPGRVARLGRGVQTFNDTILPDSKYRMTLGGPADEFASAVMDPIRMWIGTGQGVQGRYPSYFGGESMIGPAAGVVHPDATGIGERVVNFGLNLLGPGGQMASAALFNQYKNPLPPWARSLSTLFGPYSQKRTKGSRARTAPADDAAPASAGTGSSFYGI